MSDPSETNALANIDTYIEQLFIADDPVLSATLARMQEAGLPPINVSANEGKLLHLLATISGAAKILEIGTLGGYSTIWLARALPPGGRLLTLEYEAKHAAVARENIARAGLADQVEVRLGDARQLLPQIATNGEGPFDLCFIDADKVGYPEYLQWAIRLSHPGSLILSDNLIRDGAVLDPAPDNEVAVAVARFNQDLADSPHLDSIILPIIRQYVDGLGISIVRSVPAT
jgi:predicted O-methyltransferase YrrM